MFHLMRQRYLMEYYEGKDLGLIRNRIPQSLIDRFDLEILNTVIDELSYLFPANLDRSAATMPQ